MTLSKPLNNPLPDIVRSALGVDAPRVNPFDVFIDSEVNRLRRLLEFRQTHAARIDKLMAELQNRLGDRFTVGWSYGDINIFVSGTRTDLVHLLISLRKVGLVPATRPKAGDTSLMTMCRDVKEEGFSAYISFSSTQCERVLVGTQLVEQPIYEVRCK